MQALSERDRLQARIVKEIALGFKKDAVLKGGGALRFVFGSPRQSEDLDYDVVAGLTVGKAAERMARILKGLGVDFSAPKQTQTTQRWKIKLSPGIPFKVEFSRRKTLTPAEVRVTTVDFSPWNLHESGFVFHYPLEVLFQQKLYALLSSTRMASRDVFDLHFIAGLAARTGVTLELPENTTASSVLDRILEFPESQMRDELLSLLPPEMREAFDYTTLVVTLGEHLRSIEVSARAKNLSRPTRTPRL